MQLKNAKHELFCQYRSEGWSATDAHEKAGYSRNEGNAGRLNRDEHIVSRVREIQERRAKTADVTVEALTKRYNDAIKNADERGSDAAIMAGLNNLAKLHGLIVDKQRVEQGRLDGMSDAAIADDIEDRLARLAEKRVESLSEGHSGAGEAPEPEPDSELCPVSETVEVS